MSRDGGSGVRALALIDGAIHLLRNAPPAGLAAYFVGTVPFVVGMATYLVGAVLDADSHTWLGSGAWALALAFVWMKAWQVEAARHWRAYLFATPVAPLPWRVRLRSFSYQAWLQATSVVAIPFAILLLIPLPSYYAFYQNLTVLDDGSHKTARALYQEAWGAAKLWPGQTTLLLVLVSPLLLITPAVVFTVLFPFIEMLNNFGQQVLLYPILGLVGVLTLLMCPTGLLIALNLYMAMLVILQLISAFTGLDLVLLRSAGALFNDTAIVVVLGATYLVMDPVAKAAFVLRAFYANALHSGADLRAALQRRRTAHAATVMLLALALLLGGFGAQAQETSAPQEQEYALDPALLEPVLEETLLQPDYRWRAPRTPAVDEELGLVGGALHDAGQGLYQLGNWIGEQFERFWDWLTGGDRTVSADDSDAQGLYQPRVVLGILVLLLVLLLLLAGTRLALDRKRQRRAEAAEPLGEDAPDLDSEHTLADALPESGWLSMAGELFRKGEYRLAMRAQFLAELAYLAQLDLITIARYKTNLDYSRELHRRGHVFPGLLPQFQQETRAFEEVWYGAHEATREHAERMLRLSRELRTSLRA